MTNVYKIKLYKEKDFYFSEDIHIEDNDSFPLFPFVVSFENEIYTYSTTENEIIGIYQFVEPYILQDRNRINIDSNNSLTSNVNCTWKIEDGDIRIVLDTHNLQYINTDIARSKLNQEEIIKNLLRFNKFDERCDSALYDIEDQLIRAGIIPITKKKRFFIDTE